MSRQATSLLPYFGGNRTLGHRVGELLEGCTHVTVPFAGGMGELLHIGARTLVVSDLNRHAIALAGVLALPDLGPKLIRRLRRWVFHPDALRAAQERCRGYERDGPPADLVQWAEDYFACCWMTRSGVAGTGKEFRDGLSVRWDAGGGDSATRFRSAVEALRAWRRIVPRCTFLVADAFEVLAKVKDQAGCGAYCDPPWPDDGDRYTHKFSEAQQRELARVLGGFTATRVVVRFGDHELIRELYPHDKWVWHELTGRTQANGAKAEVLLVNKTTEAA